MMRFTFGQYCGALLLTLILGFAWLQPYFYPMDIGMQDLNNILSPADKISWFGTDHLGRDMFARLAAAIRLSFSLSLLSVMCALLAGLLFGILAGLFGGWYDRILSFVCDTVMALPGLLLILLFAALSPGSFWALYLGISLVMWVEFFRVTRAITRTLATSSELEASRLMGMPLFYCIKRHLLPRLLPIITTLMAFSIANAILALTTLGFINVGLRPPTAELGLMMTELFPYYYQAPLIFLQPVLAVFLLVLSLQLLSGRVK
ncbi:peptide/nickel transport system permease protein [Nicoletella semolina]|uniref:Peptide/nickel transport system permease protein n=1 Tax=Nicoletella semolina TaxID=271160 RepID=A0A4R2N4A1_9PAST|nr:ABC transporter permease [Nicoletella semolina]MDH2925095.1 ABC transporter permease [Nicoletella semolina]TCP15388.1 peptide/nickel transport system permease protein [Nicoletella semolina]